LCGLWWDLDIPYSDPDGRLISELLVCILITRLFDLLMEEILFVAPEDRVRGRGGPDGGMMLKIKGWPFHGLSRK